MFKKDQIFEFTACLFILVLSILLQAQILVTGDITWLMRIGEKFLAGGHYYTDFFEVNPPMCIYIYLIPVLMSKLFAITFTTSLLIYSYSIAIGSWLFCYSLFKKILQDSKSFYRINLTIFLTFLYFILPAHAFGQREYLFVVLFMPYLLITVLRAKQQIYCRGLTLLAGLLAGIGLAQKPFFLSTWLLIELYLILKFKNIFYGLRNETLAIIGVLCFYAISIFVLTPEYLTKILPIINTFYYVQVQFPIIVLLLRPILVYSAILFFLYSFSQQYCRQKELLAILLLATFSGLIIYLMQHTLWFYHTLPLATFSALLCTALVSEYWQRNNLFLIQDVDRETLKKLIYNIILFLLLTFPIGIGVYSQLGSFKQAVDFFDKPTFKLAKSNPGKSIFIFTEDITTNYPFFDYTQVATPSKFPCLWLISAAERLSATIKAPVTQQKAQDTKEFVINTTIDDLLQNQPSYIFIERYDNYYAVYKKHSLIYTTKLLYQHPANNHFDTFMQNPRFQHFWQNYRYQGDLGNFSVYQKFR